MRWRVSVDGVPRTITISPRSELQKFDDNGAVAPVANALPPITTFAVVAVLASDAVETLPPLIDAMT
jgi:hypothetical protein